MTNSTPINIDISIESLQIENTSFYNICFITENDVAPRTILVGSLKDLLDNGYTRDSLAYNFLVGVLSQRNQINIYIRAKRTKETYQQAFASDDNKSYYFLVIDSKDINIIRDFNSFLSVADNHKLQFFSYPETNLRDKKLVHYYQQTIPTADLAKAQFDFTEHYYLVKAYGLGFLNPKYANRLLYAYNKDYTSRGFDENSLSVMSNDYFQTARLAYPEAAWIARCGTVFPSHTTWLHKHLPKTDVVNNKNIPKLSTSSFKVLKDKATLGSGKTLQNIPIQEQVGIDWLRWALSKNIWGVLYTSNKVAATKGGVDILTNKVREVLDVTVAEGLFTSYKIKSVKHDSKRGSFSLDFSAELTYSITNVEVSGTLKY